MGNKIRNSIRAFWKGGLTEPQTKDLLDNLERQQPDLQERLKTEFVEEVDSHRLLSPEQSDELLQAIRSRAGMQTPVRTLSPYRWIGVAAVLLVFFMFGFYYMLDHRENTLAETLYTAVTPSQTLVVSSKDDSLLHVFDDGSVVLLSPYSTIHFDEDYGTGNRSLLLKGEGKFAVKRDSILPFEVVANGFTTTALGTEFIVDGRNTDNTTVHLLSGKVMVHATKEARMRIQDTYLVAGEILAIDEIHKTAITSWTVKSKPTVQLTDSRWENASLRQRQHLRFDKSDLAEVIRQIAIKFDTPITIDAEVPRNLTFTGEFSLNDSLETILHTICLVNDLQQESGPANSVLIRLRDDIHKQGVDTTEINSLPNN